MTIETINSYSDADWEKATAYKFRYYKGVKYVAAGNPAPKDFARCGHCQRAWDDNKPTGLTPAPSGRCPFEYMHRSNT